MSKKQKQIQNNDDILLENERKFNLAKQIISEKENYFNQTQSLRTKWEECWKLYINHLEEKDYPWLHNVFIPKIHEAVELLASFLVANNPTFRCLPVGAKDTIKADFMQKLISFQWNNVMKMRDKVVVWVKQGIVFGTSPMKVFWKVEKKTKKEKVKKIKFKKEPPFIEKIEEEQEIEYYEYDDPECVPVNLFDFYADPYAPDIEDSPSVIHRIIKPLEEAKKEYKNNDLIPFNEKTSPQDSSRLNPFDINQIPNYSSEEIEKTEIFERWTKDKVITIGKTKFGEVVLREEDNLYGFIPFVLFRFKLQPIPNRLYGIGLVEPNIKIQKTFNSLVNQILDNITLILNKMWIRRRGARIDPKQLISRPGGFIDADNLEADIRPVEISDIKPSALSLLQILDREFQQGTGATNLLKGLPGAEFATEIAVSQQNATIFINQIKQNLESSLRELGRKIVKLNLENITSARSIRIFENEKEFKFLEFEPEEIQGEFDIEVVADSTISQDRNVLAKQLLDFLALTIKDPEVKINRMGIYKQWLKIQGFGDIEEFFPQQPTIPEKTQETLPLQMPSNQINIPVELPTRKEGLTPEAIRQSVYSPQIPKKEI